MKPQKCLQQVGLLFFAIFFISAVTPAASGQASGSAPYGFFPIKKKAAVAWGYVMGNDTVCFNNQINDAVPMGTDRLIVAGSFTSVGPCYGNGVPLNLATGETIPGFSIDRGVAGRISKVIADGAGGWFIAGSFTGVGGVRRDRIAHLNADGTLDHTFLSDLSFGTIGQSISTLVLDPARSRLYVGGSFRSAFPKYGTVVDSTFGELTPEELGLVSEGTIDGVVYDVVSDGGGGWYIGGNFNNIRGQTASKLAHINPNGTLDAAFNPGLIDGEVRSLLLSGTTLWFGGKFTSVGGISRSGLASLSATMGVLSAANPSLSGHVNSLAKTGNTLVAGGEFSGANGILNSSGAALTSAGAIVSNQAAVVGGAAGTIHAIADDGAGGWYIGGSFTSVGGVPRSNIARINSDGTLNSWYPSGGATVNVRALAYDAAQSRLYVGGQFTTIGGISQAGFAALTTSGAVVAGWPALNAGGYLNAITVGADGRIYIGGSFSTVGGVSKTHLAVLTSAGVLDSTWALAGVGGLVTAIGLAPNGTVYAGGNFMTVGATSITRMASFTSGGVLNSTWNPSPDTNPLSIKVNSAGKVYVGGMFAQIASNWRYGLASLTVHPTTGAAVLEAWNPLPSGSYGNAIHIDGSDNIFVAGKFATAASQTRNNLASFSSAHVIQSLNMGTALLPSTTAYTVLNVSTSGNIYVGGNIRSFGGTVRSNIAGFDFSTGALTASWYPTNGANGAVTALATDSSGNVFLGGTFSSLGGQTRTYIGSLDTNGAIRTWYPGAASSTVNSIAVDSSDNIYFVGNFSTVNSQPRKLVAAADSAGTLLSWPADTFTGSSMSKIAIDGNNVFFSGNFTMLGTALRKNIASVTTAGVLRAWAPQNGVDSPVYAFAFNGSNQIYVGGGFSSIGRVRNGLAALNPLTGKMLDWAIVDENPTDYPTIYGAVLDSVGNLYVSGFFAKLGNLTRVSIASLTPAGVVRPWTPTGGILNGGSSGNVRTLAFSPDQSTLYIGGVFTLVGGLPRVGLAAVAVSTDNSEPGTVSTTFIADGGVGADIYTAAVDSLGTVYVGGSFTSLKGQSRNRIAAVASNGAVAGQWYPAGGADNYVQDIAIGADNSLYLAGSFRNIGGQPANYLAKYSATGAFVPSWKIAGGLSSTASTLAIQGSAIYAGGSFNSFGLLQRARNNIAAIDSSGRLTTWYPPGVVSSVIYSLAKGDNDIIYMGGSFSIMGGVARKNLAAINSDGSIAPWYPTDGTLAGSGANSTVSKLHYHNSTLYMAGEFASVGGITRSRIAAVNSAGTVTAFYPALTGHTSPTQPAYARQFVIDGTTAYIGGSFKKVGGVNRENLAAVSTVDGSLVPAYYPINVNTGTIDSMALYNSVMYISGSFTTIGVESRLRIGALDHPAGTANSWYPVGGAGGSGSVAKILIDGPQNLAYVGGAYTEMGGMIRNGISQVSLLSGQVTSWYPISGGISGSFPIAGMEFGPGGQLYVWGSLAEAGGKSRGGIVIIRPDGTTP